MGRRHPYHLVNPSPWPILLSVSLLSLTVSAVLYFNAFADSYNKLIASLILVVLLSSFWWRDVLREGTYLNDIQQKCF